MARYQLAVAGFFCLCLGIQSTSLAQPTPQQLQRLRQQSQAPNVQWENAELSGVIKGLQGSLIQVAAGGGENWVVQVDARPQDIRFEGQADPAFLKTGMLVEFKAKVNKRGQAAEPVSSLTVFTVREGRGVGVQAEGGLAKGEAELFNSQPVEEKKGAKGRAGEDPDYRVAGQITKLSRGEMTINCAGTTIKADLDKEAKVTVDVNNLQYAQIGDKIELRVKYPMGQKAAGQALATQVTVVASSVLGEPKKRALPARPASDEKKDTESAK
jgi:hypothetical protein